MQETVQYSINFGGDYHKNITEMTAATGKLNEEEKKLQRFVNEFVSNAFKIKTLRDAVKSIAQSLTDFYLSRSGITLDSQMHDLSAVAGVTGADY